MSEVYVVLAVLVVLCLGTWAIERWYPGKVDVYETVVAGLTKQVAHLSKEREDLRARLEASEGEAAEKSCKADSMRTAHVAFMAESHERLEAVRSERDKAQAENLKLWGAMRELKQRFRLLDAAMSAVDPRWWERSAKVAKARDALISARDAAPSQPEIDGVRSLRKVS